MTFQVRLSAIGRVGVFSIGLLGLMCLSASAQTTANCNTAATIAVNVASTGLAEKVGDIVITCTGGTSGATLIASFFVTLNTNITNQLDANGLPQGIVFSSSGATVASSPATVTGGTVQFGNLSYIVPSPSSAPVTIRISGIRAAVGSIRNGLSPSGVSATVAAVGVSLQGPQVNVAIGTDALLSSTVNYGVYCFGSAVPATKDFTGFIQAGTSASAVRVTESAQAAFAPKDSASTNGTRIIVRFSGYSAGNVALYVPNALVGNSGTLPTAAGAFGTTVASGTYTPTASQLLLSLVTGADANGAGGTLATELPVATTTFSDMTGLTVSGGSAYAVYEVLDGNSFIAESVQVPVFVGNSAVSCTTPLPTAITAMEAPISTVSVATATDPTPRYIAAPLSSDCPKAGDCNAGYFPILSVDATPISLTAAAKGPSQTVPLTVLNNGASLMSYTVSVAYQTGLNWLTVSPLSGNTAIKTTLSVVGNGTGLEPGTYSATITIDGGKAGTATVPVNLEVAPTGTLVQGIVNAASFQVGPVAPGSFVALFGLNLAGSKVGVTFNGTAAQVLYDSAGQINLVVPTSLAGQSNASVIVTVDGVASNPFNVKLATNSLGIFTPGILNSDSTVNSASNPAKRGTFVQIYFTGLATPVTGTVTVNMGAQSGIVPLYAGAQPTLPALDQVNVVIPAGLGVTGNSVSSSVCLGTLPGISPECSNSVTLYVQ